MWLISLTFNAGRRMLRLLATVSVILMLLILAAFAPAASASSDAPTNARTLPGVTAPRTLPLAPDTIIGGIDLGNLPNYLFFWADGNVDANWQGATKGFVGDAAVDGVQADERTSGGVPYAGTLYTNDSTLGAWANIVDQNDPNQVNPAQAWASTGQAARISGLETDLNNAFAQINGLAATPGYTSKALSALDNLDTQNGIAETFVINITSGLNFSTQIDITGDVGDVYVLRWDTDGNPTNGYQGQVKPQSGGAIVPHGGLKPTNFINVAGDINSSGGGSTPPPPYPQGPRYNDGTGALIVNGADFSGGGYFTGYWLTTGNPTDGQTSSLSNGIFVGGWYSLTTKFSMTSGTSGVYVSPPAIPGTPAIALEKYVSVDNQVTWDPADNAPGPYAIPGSPVYFKFVVTNTGSAPLSNVSLVDNVYNLASCPLIPNPLNTGATYSCVFGPVAAALGQHQNTATTQGVYNGTTVQAQDDAFYYGARSAIGDFVWYDANGNGIEDVGEPGLPNVTLDLYKDSVNGVKVASTVTDADGGYLFTNLPPGNYVVDVTDLNGVLTGLTHTVMFQSWPDPTPTIVLAAGELFKDADFGYVKQPGSGNALIGDTVWYDGNADGFQQPGELGIPSIQVCATPVGGGAPICKTTDTNGHYLLEVPAGSYTVAPTNPPAGYTATTPTSQTLTLSAGQQYLDADFGYDSPNLGTIGNLVFEDADQNGIFDGTNPPLGGVSVDLIRDTNGNKAWDAGEPIIATTTTATTLAASNSNYLFTAVPAGNYLVHVSDTNGVLIDETKSVLGAANVDNNNQADPYAVALASGGNIVTADFGYYPGGGGGQGGPTGKIGNQVWIEQDRDGLFNVANKDFGQPGVTVELLQNGITVASTTTGASGDYLFIGLDAGSYQVRVTDDLGVLAAYRVTKLGPNQGQDNNNQAQPYSINLPAAGRNLTADFGYTRPGAIGDFVWYDADADGIEDIGEPGIANVTLDLLLDGVVVASTVTDADGGYLFTNLAPGNYSVDVTDLNSKLAGMTHTVGNQSQTDPTPTIMLAAGQVYKDADFGYYKQPANGNAIIGDTVWYDTNADGFQQPGELGVPGITVCATPTHGGSPICATTDSNGHYLIEAPAGRYTVAPQVPPPGTVTTPSSYTVGVTAGQQYLDADFGYNTPGLGTIGNLVFRDLANNGVYDAADIGLGGVSVDLIGDTNGNTAWDAGEPVLATTTTATALGANTGNYLFTAVPAGNYLVHVSDTNAVLTDYQKSVLGAAGVDNNNQADPYPISLPSGGSNLTADFGYHPVGRPDSGVIGNQVWVEQDLNGVFNPDGNPAGGGDFGQHGVTVALFRNGSPYATTTTGASGDYSFVGLPAGSYSVQVTDSAGVLAGYALTVLGPNPGQDNNNQAQPYAITLPFGGYNLTADFGYRLPKGTIGDTVYFDDNRSGSQDGAEAGISDVIVELWTDSGGACNKLVTTLLTDVNGKYLFTDLPAAHYCVVVPPATDNPMLSGMDLTGGVNPHSVTLGPDQNYLDADFGYAGKGTVRGIVFFDLNQNTFQEPTEPGIVNVTVCLYVDANLDQQADSPQPAGYPLCTTTDATGTYVFNNLLPGGYVMTQTLPQGLINTTPITITTTLIVTQGTGLSDNNNFGDVALSSYSVTKTLTTIGQPFRQNTPISFDITIKNTGNTYIAVLPLRDTYDTNYLQYVGATPASVNNTNDGTIDWNDLTVTFGDLAPGASVTVKANFIALKDTTELPGGVTINTAVVHDALADPDGTGPLGAIVSLPTQTANAPVQVFNPTGLGLASFAAVAQGNRVMLGWTTANEQAILGFNVFRIAANGELIAVTGDLIVAKGAGTNAGATYSLVDVAGGQRYVLEIVLTNGAVERLVVDIQHPE